jgi:hypothetical protein
MFISRRRLDTPCEVTEYTPTAAMKSAARPNTMTSRV